MHPRAEQLIRDLELQPHPEGGHYAEVHRSTASTSIYFLLAAGEMSRWHRVKSEEIWPVKSERIWPPRSEQMGSLKSEEI